jgi:hypothetical protein
LLHGLVQSLHEAAVALNDLDAPRLMELLLPSVNVIGAVLRELPQLSIQSLEVVLSLAHGQREGVAIRLLSFEQDLQRLGVGCVHGLFRQPQP